jgi:hypothetical protein
MTEMINNLKPLTDKKAQLVTRYIKNWADSAKFQVCSSHLTLCGLTVNRSEMPNFSYTHPLTASGENTAKRLPSSTLKGISGNPKS